MRVACPRQMMMGTAVTAMLWVDILAQEELKGCEGAQKCMGGLSSPAEHVRLIQAELRDEAGQCVCLVSEVVCGCGTGTGRDCGVPNPSVVVDDHLAVDCQGP